MLQGWPSALQTALLYDRLAAFDLLVTALQRLMQEHPSQCERCRQLLTAPLQVHRTHITVPKRPPPVLFLQSFSTVHTSLNDGRS